MTHSGHQWKKTSGAEINENEKVVSEGNKVLKQTRIFKDFICRGQF